MSFVLRSRLLPTKGCKPGQNGVADEHNGGLSRSSSVGSLSALQGAIASREASVAGKRVRRASGVMGQDCTGAAGASTADDAAEEAMLDQPGSTQHLHSLLGTAVSWEATLQALPQPTIVPASAAVQECAACFMDNPGLTCILVADALGRAAGLLTRKDMARVRAARLGNRSGHLAGTITPPAASDAVLEAAAGTSWSMEPAMLWAATPVMTIPRTLASPTAAAALMLGHGVTCLPVTDDLGRPIGILTREAVSAQLLAAHTANTSPGDSGSAPDASVMLAQLMRGAGRREALMRFSELEELSAALPPPSPSASHAGTGTVTPTPSTSALGLGKPPVPSSYALHRLHLQQQQHGACCSRSHSQSRLSQSGVSGVDSRNGSYDDLSLVRVAVAHSAEDRASRMRRGSDGDKEHKEADKDKEKEKVRALVMDSAWDLLDGVAGVLAVSAAATMVDPSAVAAAASSAATAAANAAQGGLFDLSRVFHVADQGKDSVRVLSDILKGVSSVGTMSGLPSAVRALVDADCPICRTLQVVLDKLDMGQHTIAWDSITDPDTAQMYADAAGSAASSGDAMPPSLPLAAADLDPLAAAQEAAAASGPGKLSLPKLDKAVALEVLHTASAGQNVAKGLPAVLRIIAAIDPAWVEVLNVLPLVLPLAGPSFDYMAAHTKEMGAKWVSFLEHTKLDQMILGAPINFGTSSNGGGLVPAHAGNSQ